MIDLSKTEDNPTTRPATDVTPTADTQYTQRLESTLDSAQQLVEQAGVETTCALSIVLPVYDRP